MKPIDILKELHLKNQELKYPTFPKEYLNPYKFKPNSTNGLTKCVVDFLNLSGHFAERTNTMGRVIDNRKTYTDVIGRKVTIGSTQYIPSTGTLGSSDIKAVINGKSVAIEIKWQKDKQSNAQKEYQERFESSGGIYIIVKDFDSFYQWYSSDFMI